MKKIVAVLILLLGFIASYGQEADSTITIIPDSTYEVHTDFIHIIYYIVSDSTSEYYYPKLENKVKNNKVKMTAEECYYLYYGRLFKPGQKTLPILASKERMDFERAIATENKKAIINIGIPLLESNPVDLTVLMHVGRCLKERNDKRFEEYAWLYMKLLEAIFSIGNGQTPETAFKVIDIEDEHILKGALGFIGGTESLYAREDLPGRIFTVWNRNGQKLYFEELCFEDKNGLQLK